MKKIFYINLCSFTECLCTADCSETNNCCFPNPKSNKRIFEGNDIRNGISCLYPMIPQPSADIKHLLQSFIVVTSVQRNIAVGSSNMSCGDINVAPWGSFYPVYSTKTKRIYKNIECAREECEDSDIILWDAFINCKDQQRDQGITMVVNGLDTNSLPEGCRINFIFPGNYDVLQHLKCYINLIDTCSESHDFVVPEGTNVSKSDIRTLCTNSTIVSPYRATKMYANVFCHICNAETFSRNNFCFKFKSGLGVKVENTGGFTALIDDSIITEKRETGNIKNRDLPIACSVSKYSCLISEE